MSESGKYSTIRAGELADMLADTAPGATVAIADRKGRLFRLDGFVGSDGLVIMTTERTPGRPLNGFGEDTWARRLWWRLRWGA